MVAKRRAKRAAADNASGNGRSGPILEVGI